MKTIAIFGASGATGQILVRQALNRGWQVNALCRHRSALEGKDKKLLVYEGNITPEACKQVINDADSVICALGQRPKAMQPFCADATTIILQAMKECGVQRFICITGAMVGDRNEQSRSWFIQQMVKAFRKKMPQIAEDRVAQEKITATSSVKWTIVKPPRLSDSTIPKKVIAAESLPVTAFSSISRSNLAAYILSILDDSSTIEKLLVVRS